MEGVTEGRMAGIEGGWEGVRGQRKEGGTDGGEDEREGEIEGGKEGGKRNIGR